MTPDKVIFYKFKSKKLVWINIFVLDLDLVLKCLFFCLQMWKGVTDNKKAKRLSKEEIKKKLLDSMNIGEIVEFDDLNKEAEETQDPEEAAKIIKGYEDIIKTKNKRIILRFKEKEKFPSVNQDFTKPPSSLKLIFLNCVKNTPNY